MSAEDQIRREIVRVEAMTQQVFLGVATEALRSIQEGSELTGAPGQPVDTGALKGSWQLTFPTPSLAQIGTNVVYAPVIEDGLVSLQGRRGDAGVSAAGSNQRLTLRSKGGGFHSVRLTIAGLPRIVEAVTRRVAGGQR